MSHACRFEGRDQAGVRTYSDSWYHIMDCIPCLKFFGCLLSFGTKKTEVADSQAVCIERHNSRAHSASEGDSARPAFTPQHFLQARLLRSCARGRAIQ